MTSRERNGMILLSLVVVGIILTGVFMKNCSGEEAPPPPPAEVESLSMPDAVNYKDSEESGSRGRKKSGGHGRKKSGSRKKSSSGKSNAQKTMPERVDPFSDTIPMLD